MSEFKDYEKYEKEGREAFNDICKIIAKDIIDGGKNTIA